MYKYGTTEITFKMTKFYATMNSVKLRLSAPAGIVWQPVTRFGYKQAASTQAELGPAYIVLPCAAVFGFFFVRTDAITLNLI